MSSLFPEPSTLFLIKSSINEFNDSGLFTQAEKESFHVVANICEAPV